MTDLDSVTTKEAEKAKNGTTQKAKKNTTKKTKTTTKKEELQNESTEISKGTDLRDGRLLPEPGHLLRDGNSEPGVERADTSTEEKESDQKGSEEDSQEVTQEESSKEEVVTSTTSLSTTPSSKKKKRKVNQLTPEQLARWRGMPWPTPSK